MTRIHTTIPILLLLCLQTGFKTVQKHSADAIMERVVEEHSVDTEIAQIKINTTDRRGETTERKMLSIIRRDPAGNYSTLIHFLEPKEINGTTLLLSDKGHNQSKQYLYLPALGKLREIQGSQRATYLLGTDFSYEDLRKEKTVEYRYQRQQDGKVGDKEVYVILALPADKQKLETSGYGSRLLYIEKDTYHILKIDYYDESGKLLKTFRAYDYSSEKIDGISKRPRRAVMTNHETGSTTVMVLQKSRLNYSIDPRLFTKTSIQNWDKKHTSAYMDVFDQPQN